MDFEIREDRERTRGRRALSRERAAYLRLVQQGLSNKEACRIVGINLRTGRRWRTNAIRPASTWGRHRSHRRRPQPRHHARAARRRPARLAGHQPGRA
ncbi:helix-turn-helix domain-containing protein [Nonomuraea antimicrobica]